MENIELKLNDKKTGFFEIKKDGEVMSEMAIGIQGQNMTVYHTEVADELKGKGIAPRLLETKVAYVRKNSLKVISLCTYVLAQFKRHPDEYAHIWNTKWHN